MIFDLIVIGGGAAGFFAAIQLAEQAPGSKILILEQGLKVLEKVKVSGGGRCNVTHACFDPRELVKFYPRGNKALRGPFHQFMCGDMIAWLDEKNVPTKIEADGRMFPTSNKSQSIIDCFLTCIQKYKIEVVKKCRVSSFKKDGEHWNLETPENNFTTKNLLVATGSSKRIWEHLEQLGHKIIEPIPSLFTFKISNPLLRDLPGLSVANGSVRIADSKLNESGPILITHWGLSGPGILKLSAWGARLLHERNYNFSIFINWTSIHFNDVESEIKSLKSNFGSKKIISKNLFDIPKRLWQRMLGILKIETLNWADLSNKKINAFATMLTNCELQVTGKSTFKEEFVTCGGVDLKEVNFKKMESKLFSNLFFAGEVLDIDAVTGGFNFQAAWTTAWLVAQSVANEVTEL